MLVCPKAYHTAPGLGSGAAAFGGSRMDEEALRAAYLDLMMDEPGTPLATFLERALAGEWGPPPGPAAVDAFLRSVARDVASSIRAQAAAHPELAPEVEARLEEAEAELDALRQRFLPGRR
jgi:hypothetical protein